MTDIVWTPPKGEEIEHLFARERVCKHCFMCEEIQSKTFEEVINPVCDYCLKHAPKGEKLLERMLEIMHKTRMHDFPHVLRLMYEVLKEKKND